MNYFLGLFTGLLLGVLVAIGYPSANAAPLTERQASDIYAVAYGQYHGPREWLEKQPNIYIVDQERICGIVGQSSDCRVLGLSLDGVVYIRNDLDFGTTFAASILVHEYVHHFQWLEGKHDAVAAAVSAGNDHAACELWVANELQAYLIQVNVLEKAGDYTGAAKAEAEIGKLRCN